MLYVNLYLADQAYGGPEEGGWWFDCGEPVRSFPVVTRRRADRLEAMVQRIADHRNKTGRRRPPSSVLCDGWYVVRTEATPAAAYPAERPHYE